MTRRIKKVLVIRDEAQGKWFNVFKAPGIDGKPVRAQVPREVRTAGKVAAELLNAGASFTDIDDDDIKAAIRSKAPIEYRRAQVGWLPRGAAFVGNLHVAYHRSTTITYLPPVGAAPAVSAGLGRRGTLRGWQNVVAIAEHSTGMIVGLCASFAAPLLFLLKRPSFGLVLQGGSRLGKTTAQVVGASAQGLGSAETLPTLNATPAGLLALGVASNDHALFVDEIGTARGPKQEVYVALRDTTYAFMSGRDVLRHPSWSGATGSAPSTFRVILVLSSEHSPDTWAARNGETRDPGETARLITLPLGAMGQSIFDRPPPDLTEAERVSWESEQLTRLHEGIPQQRGIAFGHYLNALTRKPQVSATLARQLVEQFQKSLAKHGTSPIARDIIAKFGVLYAGGIIAARVKVLTIPKGAISYAVKRACIAALSALPDPQADLKQDLATLKARLQDGGIVDVSHADERALRHLGQADGFTRRRGDGREWVIRAQAFARWFNNPSDTRNMLDYLAEEGFIQLARPATQGRSNAWAQHQTLWPDGTRPRSITIFLPHGVEDLAVGAGQPDS